MNSGGEAKHLKTDKQYQYPSLLPALTTALIHYFLSLHTDLVQNPELGAHDVIQDSCTLFYPDFYFDCTSFYLTSVLLPSCVWENATVHVRAFGCNLF